MKMKDSLGGYVRLETMELNVQSVINPMNQEKV